MEVGVGDISHPSTQQSKLDIQLLWRRRRRQQQQQKKKPSLLSFILLSFSFFVLLNTLFSFFGLLQ
jgi:hypothetical protein